MYRAAWGLLALAALAAAENPATEECDLGRPKSQWITSVLYQALVDYVPSGEYPLDPCTKDGQIYAENLANLTYWATKMFDASSQGITPGILEGRNFEFGHFDECASASSTYHGIKGKYVMAQLQFEPKAELFPNFNERKRVYKIPREEASAWEAVKPTNDRRVEDRNTVRWAVCVPSSCTDRDIEISLQKKVYPAMETHSILGNLTVLPDYSYTRDDSSPPPSKGQYIFWIITMFLMGVVMASTIYDINNPLKEDDPKPWFLDFSLRKNMGDLFKTPKNEFSVLSGLKVLSMFLVIYGHRMMASVSSPQFNPNTLHLATGEYLMTYIDNGHLVVNTFMTVTGFLTFFKITKDLYNNKDLKVCRSIFNRFMRLTPAYLFVMAAQYYIFQYVEGGPLGRNVVWDTRVFGTYWWTHLSYLNNYIAPAKQCLIPSWYMALDMQMYIFAYLLGAVVQKMRSLTPYALSLATIVSLALPAITVAYTKYWGTYLIFYTPLMEYFEDPEFQALYMPTHTRAAPYVIGMFGGYIYYHIKAKKVTFQKKTMWVCSFLAFGAMHASCCWSYPFFLPDRDYVLWENVAYAWLHRVGWAVPIVWAVVASAIGNFKPYKYLLGLPVYEPFNKLSYTALLVHGLIQVYMMGTIRSPINYGKITSIWMGCGDICFTYGFSIIIYCLVEGPFALLQQKLWNLPIFSKDPKPIKK